MPHITTDDGVKLYYEETGSGETVIFVHEFAGDHRSWEPQMRHFSKRYRCIAYNARGYPPSDVPQDVALFSLDRAREDLKAILVGIGIERALSLVVAGCGYGAEKDKREQFQSEAEAASNFVENAQSGEEFAGSYALGPTRVQFQNNNPRGWQEFHDMLAQHSLQGSAMTLRGVQKSRPSLFDLEEQLKQLVVPTLVLTGDEDEPCLIPNVFLKRTIPSAALQILPNAGHTINLEDPDAFNGAVSDFLAQVDAGRWPIRDPRSLGSSILGVKK
jgi:pimeloyl-ACP methyl ester carboxylesterase